MELKHIILILESGFTYTSLMNNNNNTSNNNDWLYF